MSTSTPSTTIYQTKPTATLIEKTNEITTVTTKDMTYETIHTTTHETANEAFRQEKWIQIDTPDGKHACSMIRATSYYYNYYEPIFDVDDYGQSLTNIRDPNFCKG